MSVYTQNFQNPLPVGFYDEFDELFRCDGYIARKTARSYYTRQQELALSAMLRAIEFIELLNDYQSPAMVPFAYYPDAALRRHCRRESEYMLSEIVYMYKCAKAHFENAITARIYVADEYFDGILDAGHQEVVDMIDAERKNIDRYLFPLECYCAWTHDLSAAKPQVARYVFADSRFATGSKTITFPDHCVAEMSVEAPPCSVY